MALALSDIFRMPTGVVYPPFKNGLYLEEAFYFFYQANKEHFETLPYVYIPAFWTNVQIHPQFSQFKERMQEELDEAIKVYSPDQKFFTIVQHDDACLLRLPKHTLVFGACSGHIPLPLIYEDRQRLLDSLPKQTFAQKPILLSFVGSLTHTLRREMVQYKKDHQMPWILDTGDEPLDAHKPRNQVFLDTTRESRFCLAPRGYGRSSFRFFEAFLLGSIPVYIWDDVEWLPYKEHLNYKEFCISVNMQELPSLQEKLSSITEEQYNTMLAKYNEIKEWFSLFGMSRYILEYLLSHPNLSIESLPYYRGQGSL